MTAREEAISGDEATGLLSGDLDFQVLVAIGFSFGSLGGILGVEHGLGEVVDRGKR